MNYPLFHQALQAEEGQPRRALALYEQLDRENRRFHLDILLLAIGCPVLASLIAFALSPLLGQQQTLATVAILAALGFGPPWALFISRLPSTKTGWKVFSAVLGIILTLFSDLLTVVVILLVGLGLSLVVLLLIGGPFYLLTRQPLPGYVVAAVVTFFALYSLALALSNTDPRSQFHLLMDGISRHPKGDEPGLSHALKRMLAEIAVGLRLNWQEALQFLGTLAMGAVLSGAGPLGLLYRYPYQAALSSGVAGALLGLGLSHGERDPLLGPLIGLGRVRCLLRLSRFPEADYWLRLMQDQHPSDAIDGLTTVLWEVAQQMSRRGEGSRPSLELTKRLQDLAEQRQRMGQHGDLWEASVRKTAALAGLEQPCPLLTRPSSEGPAEALIRDWTRRSWPEVMERLRQKEPDGEGPLHRTLREDLLRVMRSPWRPVAERVSAGDALAQIGDPRFDPLWYYLPKEPLLGFVAIPAGPFQMGSDPQKDSRSRRNERPAHEVYLPAFYIARYPVTVAQFERFLAQTRYVPKYRCTQDGVSTSPAGWVTWREALRYCAWLNDQLRQRVHERLSVAGLTQNEQAFWQGIRDGALIITLPSEAEWEKAARGTDGRRFPWGDASDPERANCLDTGIGTSCAVGCFPTGASPYGVEDMTGNGEEWTRSVYRRYPYDSTDGREGLRVSQKDWVVYRGGAHHTEATRCACRGQAKPDAGLGFRLAASSPGGGI